MGKDQRFSGDQVNYFHKEVTMRKYFVGVTVLLFVIIISITALTSFGTFLGLVLQMVYLGIMLIVLPAYFCSIVNLMHKYHHYEF